MLVHFYANNLFILISTVVWTAPLILSWIPFASASVSPMIHSQQRILLLLLCPDYEEFSIVFAILSHSLERHFCISESFFSFASFRIMLR